MKSTNQQTDQAWYQFLEVWLMITLPLMVVIASIVTIVIAFQHAPQLVSESPTPALQITSSSATSELEQRTNIIQQGD